MSSIMVVTVVLYSKKNVIICEVQNFKSNTGHNFNRFYIHTLADSERLTTTE